MDATVGAGWGLCVAMGWFLHRSLGRAGQGVEAVVRGCRLVAHSSGHRGHSGHLAETRGCATTASRPFLLLPRLGVQGVGKVRRVVREGAEYTLRLDGLVPRLEATVEDGKVERESYAEAQRG